MLRMAFLSQAVVKLENQNGCEVLSMSSIKGFFRKLSFFPRGGFAFSAILSLVLLALITQPGSAQTSETLTSGSEVNIPDFDATPFPSAFPLTTPTRKPSPTEKPAAVALTPEASYSAESEGTMDTFLAWLKNSKENYFRWALWAFGGFFVFMLAWYCLRVMKSFRRDRGYLTGHTDDQPSVDERLLSELAPMEVALLRGSIDGYYEKVFYLTRQLLRSRNLLDNMDLSMNDIVIHLHTMGVDPAFLDCVESIFERCTAVCERNERPKAKAHQKLREDLSTLIHMNPFSVAVGRKRDKKIEKPKEDLLNSPAPSDDDE